LEEANHQLNQHISDLFNEKYSLLETQFHYEKQLDEKENQMNHIQSELETLVRSLCRGFYAFFFVSSFFEKQLIQNDIPLHISTQNKSFLFEQYQILQQQLTHYLNYEKNELETKLHQYRSILYGKLSTLSSLYVLF
jgi:hypothetical protein